jgi:anaerobic dimethyl sulfoxide reductase subunit A
MKRKNWQPGGGSNSNGHLRGKDEWIRITWDEAFSLATQEFKRILADVTPTNTPEKMYGVLDFIDGAPKEYHSEYGKNLPILNLAYSNNPIFLNAAGYGTIPVWGHNSSGAFPAVVAKMAASPIGTANTVGTDRLTVQNHSNLILLWGQNPAWSKYGPTQIAYMNARKRGAKIICVDSWFSPGNSALVDEWIPCRPGTDTALLIAVAYLLIKHDEDPEKLSEPRWIDQNFLDKYTVGFSADSVPTTDSGGNPIYTPKYGSDGKPVMIPSGNYDDNGNSIMTYELVVPEAGDNFHDYVMGVG